MIRIRHSGLDQQPVWLRGTPSPRCVRISRWSSRAFSPCAAPVPTAPRNLPTAIRGVASSDESMTSHFIQPNCGLETKCDWNCCLTMGSSQHNRVTFTLCYISADTMRRQSCSRRSTMLSLVAGDRCINNVVGCCTEVNAPTCIASSLCHGFGQSHDVVTGFCFDLRDPFFTYRSGLRWQLLHCNRLQTLDRVANVPK